jgi:Cys-rich peptide (Clo7bot family)
MKFIKEPSSKFVLGFCNVCKENCHNDCVTQSGCGYCAGYNEGK